MQQHYTFNLKRKGLNMVRRYSNGAWVDISSPKIYEGGGWREPTSIKRYDSSSKAWVEVWPVVKPLTFTLYGHSGDADYIASGGNGATFSCRANSDFISANVRVYAPIEFPKRSEVSVIVSGSYSGSYSDNQAGTISQNLSVSYGFQYSSDFISNISIADYNLFGRGPIDETVKTETTYYDCVGIFVGASVSGNRTSGGQSYLPSLTVWLEKINITINGVEYVGIFQ